MRTRAHTHNRSPATSSEQAISNLDLDDRDTVSCNLGPGGVSESGAGELSFSLDGRGGGDDGYGGDSGDFGNDNDPAGGV